MNKFSYVWSQDNSGLKILKLLNGFKRQKIELNALINVVAVKIYPKTRKVINKKEKYYGKVVSLKKITTRYDGTNFKNNLNKCVTFEKKRFKFLGSKIYGCVQKETLNNSIKIQKVLKFSKMVI